MGICGSEETEGPCHIQQKGCYDLGAIDLHEHEMTISMSVPRRRRRHFFDICVPIRMQIFDSNPIPAPKQKSDTSGNKIIRCSASLLCYGRENDRPPSDLRSGIPSRTTTNCTGQSLHQKCRLVTSVQARFPPLPKQTIA